MVVKVFEEVYIERRKRIRERKRKRKKCVHVAVTNGIALAAQKQVAR